ncbi:MAG TPA: cytochrome c maturation protein CcmE [Chloroflexota bacterium]|nr:cytochrome c maturation protein CcmE [Chloroflexota bacterium]
MATEAGHDPRTQPLPPAAGLGQHRARGAGAWPVPPKLLIGGGLLVAAIVFLVVTSLQSNAVYYVTASELLARGSAASGQTVRLAGAVVDGSIQHDRTHLRFELTDGTASLPVEHTGTIPDLFGYRAEGAYQDVVVEGRLGADGVFEARNIIVKHGPALEAADTGTSR